MKIYVLYFNALQRASITEEALNDEADKIIQSADISHPPSSTTPVLAQWAHGWSREDMVTGIEAMQGTNTQSPVLIQLLVPSNTHPASNTEQHFLPKTAPSLKETHSHLCRRP